MTVTPTAAEPRTSAASAGAVLLWCVLAGAAVSGALLIEPSDNRGLEFLSPAGALRLLVDLAIFHVVFLVPLFAWRKEHPFRAADAAAAVVLFTASVGIVMIDTLVGLGAGTLATLIGFVVLAGAGAVVWAEALGDRPSVYFGFASIVALGVPLVAFFADELFRIQATWLAWFSPFTGWRAVVDRGDWVPWVVFGADLALGAVCLAVRRGRAKR